MLLARQPARRRAVQREEQLAEAQREEQLAEALPVERLVGQHRQVVLQVVLPFL